MGRGDGTNRTAPLSLSFGRGQQAPLALHVQQTRVQADGAGSEPRNEADPIAEGTEVGQMGEQVAARQTDDPIRDEGNDERHVDVLVAPKRSLDGSRERIRQLEENCKQQELLGQRRDGRLSGIQRRHLIVHREDEQGAESGHADGSREPEIAVLLGVPEPSRSRLVADEDRQHHRDAERHHVQEGGEIDRGLVRRNRERVIFTHEQRDCGEDAGLEEDRESDRDADAQQLAPCLARDAVPAAPEGIAAERVHLGHDEQSDQADEPVGDSRGDARTDAAKPGKAPIAEDEQVVQEAVHRQRQDGNEHGDACLAERVDEAAQHGVDEERQNARGEGEQEAVRRRADRRLQAHPVQHGADAEEHRRDNDDRESGREIECLHEREADLVTPLLAHQLSHNRRDGEQNAGEAGLHRHPEAGANSDAGQIGGTRMSGHERIEERHGVHGELGNENWEQNDE